MVLSSGTGIRVVRQPSNQIIYLEGTQGFIEEIAEIDPKLGQIYLIRALNEKGKSLGVGRIPGSCLIVDDSPASKKCKETYLSNPSEA